MTTRREGEGSQTDLARLALDKPVVANTRSCVYFQITKYCASLFVLMSSPRNLNVTDWSNSLVSLFEKGLVKFAPFQSSIVMQISTLSHRGTLVARSIEQLCYQLVSSLLSQDDIQPNCLNGTHCCLFCRFSSCFPKSNECHH